MSDDDADNRPSVNLAGELARSLALIRLTQHLRELYSYAEKREFPAALMLLSDVQSDLDDLAVIE